MSPHDYPEDMIPRNAREAREQAEAYERLIVDLKPDEEIVGVVKTRAEVDAWLAARKLRVAIDEGEREDRAEAEAPTPSRVQPRTEKP